MALTASEQKQLYAELRQLQISNPGVVVSIDMSTAVLAVAQARVDEIEGIIAAGIAKRTAPADLEA